MNKKKPVWQPLFGKLGRTHRMRGAATEKSEHVGLEELFDLEDTLVAAADSIQRLPKRDENHFIIASLFLSECYDYLMPREEESLHYISGLMIGPYKVLDQLVPFRLEKQEMAYVRGDIVSSTEALVKLGERGFRLLGHAHCHPGSGAGCTYPSTIDYAHQRRLERGGYRTLGLIMTRDGHFRFFTDEMPFTVEVIGKDVEQLDEESFKLTLDFFKTEHIDEDKTSV